MLTTENGLITNCHSHVGVDALFKCGNKLQICEITVTNLEFS